jgi:hypothetical protein
MNLPDDRIEVYRDPAPEGYRSITLVPRDGAVTPWPFLRSRFPAPSYCRSCRCRR